MSGKNNCDFFRGAEIDVLDRLTKAALKFHLKNVIRISADSPFIDPKIINKGYRLYKSTDGGQTWGDIDTDIIPVDTDGDGIGEIVGWRPIARFDLTELQDTTRCIYY